MGETLRQVIDDRTIYSTSIDESTEASNSLSEADMKFFSRAVEQVRQTTQQHQICEKAFQDAHVQWERARGAFELIMEVMVEKYALNPDKGDRIDEIGRISRPSKNF